MNVQGQLFEIELHPRSIRVDVRGMPRPQGSLQTFATPNGKIAAKYGAPVWVWRRLVQTAVEELKAEPFTGSVELRLGFDLPRPLDHFLPVNSKRSAPEINERAPQHPMGMPDLDKLIRCVDDAITDAGLWHDDSQVVSLTAAKRYVTGPPGVLITVTELP